MIEYKNFTNECGIYCFTNKVNGKCYVGQAVNLKKRLRSHYSSMKKRNVPNMIFYDAINKYGIDNFDLEILEFLDPNMDLKSLKDLLDEKEKFYIKEKNSYVPGGYNQTLGGDAGVLGYKMTEEQKEKIRIAVQPQKEKNKRHIWIRNISESKYYCGYTYEEASKKSGVSRSIIQAICNKRYKHPYAKGWTFADNEITLFNNCATAFRDMAKGMYAVNGGKFVSGQFTDTFLKNVRREVIELDACGNIIKEFNSVKSVVEELKCNPRSFSNYLHRDNQKFFKNRIFKFKIPPVKRKYSQEHLAKLRAANRASKEVFQYDLQNNLITSYKSIAEACKATGADRKAIVKCCKGVFKTCKGFVWKFKN